jgi:hypothetical protein
LALSPLIGGVLPLRKPPEIAVGNRVRYYPRSSESNYGSGAGILVTISSVDEWPALTVLNASKPTYALYPRGYALGEEGTWEYLDFRDRLALRLHGTHVEHFLTAFENDATLFDFWVTKGVNWRESPIHNIVQKEYVAHNYNPAIGALWGELTLSNFQRAAELGIPINLGVLPAAGMTLQSDWWDPAWWLYESQHLAYFYNLVKDYCGPWLELQQETSGSVFQITPTILAANGVSLKQFKAARQPFLDAITSTGLRTITRPMGGTLTNGTNDVAFPLDLQAAAPGSIYCSEFQTVLAKQFRMDEHTAYHRIGGGNDSGNKPAQWRNYRSGMPVASQHVQLRSGGELRMSGDVLRENFREADENYPLIELVELVDGWRDGIDPMFPHPRGLGTRNWYYQEYMADTGTARTSANDVRCLWTLAGEPDGSGLDVKSKRCCGKDRGTARQLAINPRRRAITGSIDVTIPPANQPFARGFICGVNAANDVQCWHISGTIWLDPTTLINDLAFTMAASFYFPSLPGAGEIWGLAGNGQQNSSTGSWALVSNGDQGGRLELRTRNNTGVDTFVLGVPPTGANHRVVWGYNGTTQWLTGSTTVTPVYASPASGKVRDRSGLAILLGGAHNPAASNTTIWGFPDGILPFDTDVQYWNRGLTVAEATSVIEHRWPYNYTAFM